MFIIQKDGKTTDVISPEINVLITIKLEIFMVNPCKKHYINHPIIKLSSHY